MFLVLDSFSDPESDSLVVFFPAPLDSFQVSVLSAFIDYSFKVSLKLPSNLPGVPVLHQPYCLYFSVIFLVIYGQ